MDIKKDIEFLEQIYMVNEDYPETNPWRKTVPLKLVLAILEKYK